MGETISSVNARDSKGTASGGTDDLACAVERSIALLQEASVKALEIIDSQPRETDAGRAAMFVFSAVEASVRDLGGAFAALERAGY